MLAAVCAWQVAAPAAENLPAAQSVQVLAPAAENLPAAQAVQVLKVYGNKRIITVVQFNKANTTQS